MDLEVEKEISKLKQVEKEVVSIIHFPTSNGSHGTNQVSYNEASKEIANAEKESDVFVEMKLSKKFAKQTKENLYSQIVHEGPVSLSLLSSIYYDKGTLKMTILQPKVDKPKKDLKPNEHDTTKNF
jgi:hypothetical protein